MFHYGKVFGLAVVLGAAALPHSSAQERAMPEGVIHVSLPAGGFSIENIVRKGKPLLRFGVGKNVIEAQTIFLGDTVGVQQIEAIKEGMHWVPAKGGKGYVFDGLQIYEHGSTFAGRDYLRVNQLKAGSVYVTAPTINFFWWPDAPEKPKPPQERPALPEGVIHVALPPGEVRMENILRNGKPLIRLTVGKTVIEARSIFRGDAKGATHYEAIKDGIHWAPASGRKGFVTDGVTTEEPGSTIADGDFHPLEKLKAGSLFGTTPSVKFEWGPAAKLKARP